MRLYLVQYGTLYWRHMYESVCMSDFVLGVLRAHTPNL